MSNEQQYLKPFVIALSVLLWGPLAALAGNNGQFALLREAQTNGLSDRAWAVVHAPDMRRGSLLMLRGAVGRARATFRTNTGTWCPSVPVRLLLGDFSGDSIAVGRSGPALALIINRKVAETMRSGRDITSDALRVSGVQEALSHPNEDIDIVLAGSASPADGFVFNMGSNLLSNIFGVQPVSGPCIHGSAEIALR